MELPQLIKALSNPTLYSGVGGGQVEVIHTHISVVFLAGKDVYKIKKPVNLGFLDFDTIEKRRHFCEEEVRLNRRLAPRVYRGVIPITLDQGSVRYGGEGEIIEWAVHMERLPELARLDDRIRRGEIEPETLVHLAQNLARFHAQAEVRPQAAELGRYEAVARNLRENLEFPPTQLGVTVSQTVLQRLKTLMNEALAQFQALIVNRAERGVPRDCHGDLHLDHIYLFPDRSPPDDLLIVDCIEFNERFRFIDPVADMAFLYMDLLFHGRDDLARVFQESYFLASGDEEGKSLLPLYTAYRASVRGKVEGLKMDEAEVPEEDKAKAIRRSKVFWQLALRTLEQPKRRPCLVLVAGLPGTGKSTLSRALAENAGFEVIRSDVVRKELAKQAGLSEEAGRFQEDIYTETWTERTYTECLRRAAEGLSEGGRWIVDASFVKDRWRQTFLEAAQSWGVPVVFLVCQAEPELVRERLQNRKHDISDADWNIYQLAAERWEEPGEKTKSALRQINTAQGPEALAFAQEALYTSGVF